MPVGDQILRLLIAQRFDEPRQIGRMPGHQKHGRRFEAIDQHAAFAIDVWCEGADDGLRAACAKPFLCGLRQRAHHLYVVDGVERAELPARGGDGLDLGLIDLRADAADPFAVLARQKLLRLHMLEMRIELVAVEVPALGVERGREAFRAFIDETRQLAEGQESRKIIDGNNLDAGHSEHLSFICFDRKRSYRRGTSV